MGLKLKERPGEMVSAFWRTAAEGDAPYPWRSAGPVSAQLRTGRAACGRGAAIRPPIGGG